MKKIALLVICLVVAVEGSWAQRVSDSPGLGQNPHYGFGEVNTEAAVVASLLLK